MAITSTSNANQASFRKLLMVAFVIAMLGLFGNLMHLHSLTTKFKHEPSDLVTHYITSHENDEAAKVQQQLQLSPTSAQEQQQRQRRATLEEDSNNKEQPDPPVATSLLRRLLRESIDSLEACRRAKIASNSGKQIIFEGARNYQSKNGGRRRLLEESTLRHRRPLAQFGWLNTLTNYLATSSINGEMMQQQQRRHEECSIPSSQPACHIQNMTMLVLSQGTDLRRLFVNLLSWLLYSPVAEISVLLPTSAWTTLSHDIKYGRRLQDWHDDSNHKVHLIPYNQSLWDGIQSFYARTKHVPATDSTGRSSVVVFVNGDVRWRGNDEGLQSGLALWQRHPASVVASNSFTIRVHPPLPHRPLGNRTSLPFCKQQTVKREVAALVRRLEGGAVEVNEAQRDEGNEDDDNSSLTILDLSGLMIHRDYLCLLSHQYVINPLSRFASGFDEVQVTMSILLTLASIVAFDAGTTPQTQIPRLYPLRLRRHSNVTTTDSMTSDGSLEDEIENSRTSRSLGWSGATRRGLAEGDHQGQNKMSLNDETITNILGYFGSSSPRPKKWCTERQLDGDRATTFLCSSLLGNDEPSSQDLDWLRPGNPEYGLCPSIQQ